MRVMLRIDLPDTAEGDNCLADLVSEWLHGEGEVIIGTPNYDTHARLTYVKEQ